VILIVTELSIEHHPLETYLGLGTTSVIRTDVLTGDFDSPFNVFLAAMGVHYACEECGYLSDEESIIVPVTHTLREATDVNIDVISHTEQDVVIIRGNCMDLPKANDADLEHSEVKVVVHSISRGASASTLDFEIHSHKNFEGDIVLKRCFINTSDYRTSTAVKYNISSQRRATRKGIIGLHSIKGEKCTKIGNYCLNDAIRDDLGYSLLISAFAVGNFTFDQDYSLASGVFPDPSLELTPKQYSNRMMKFIAGVLLVAASHKTDRFIKNEVYTDTIGVIFYIPLWLAYFSFILSLITTLIGVFYVVTDVLKLDKTSNVLLRRLSMSIKPGKYQLEDFTKFVSLSLADGIDRWENIPIRFGEDIETKKEEVGELMFGTKNDVIHFKDLREYKDGF
jgi:hypothetical protein